MSTPDKSLSGFTPFVPEETALPELTVRAVVLGVLMAIVLGAANAYLGMRAGLTVAATFPAAVVAMAAMRALGGSVLEENISRTTASVGEALVAGAIFTIPAFVISGVWDELRYWESTAIMFVGGLLGVLFIIVLRRTMVVEAELPFLALERLLMEASQRGADRQDAHESLRVHTREASAAVNRGEPNPLCELLAADEIFAPLAPLFGELLDPAGFVGRAPEQVVEFIEAEVDPLLARHGELPRVEGEVRV